MPTSSAQLPKPSSTVVYRPVAEGAVLLNLQDEIYFGLNAAGRTIWEALTTADATLESVVVALEAQFPGVARDTLRADAQDLIAELHGRHLVTPGE